MSLQGNEDLFRRSMNQGHSAAWEGRWQEAMEHYSRALAEFPDNAPTMNSLALAHLELGNGEQALELYRRASQVTPEDPLPFEKMAQIFKQTGRTDEAVKLSMQAAERHLKLRDADKAINNWTRVIRMMPENIDAHSKLAAVYEKLGRSNQAITEYIAVASLQQNSGMKDEAMRSGEHALSLNPKNTEAQKAVAMLHASQSLPKPVRQGGVSGPLRLRHGGTRTLNHKPVQPKFDEGFDPVEEATQKSLQSLANMLFDLAPAEPQPTRRTSSLRSIARVVSDGFLARGFDEAAIVGHLSRAIDLHSARTLTESAKELQAAIAAGLDHPAAHFNLGILMLDEGESETAQRSFQQAVKHGDFALASRLLLGDHYRQQEKYSEAVREYLHALSVADSSVVPPEKTLALRDAYEPLIAEMAQADENEIKLLCENIRHLLMQPDWRIGVNEARGQLPGVAVDAAPLPVAEVLTHANSGRLVDALARINRISRDGYLRAAMEEAYIALEFSPSYLPLHIHMGELLLMSDKPQQATEKLSTVARVYAARGESDRATQMYERVVQISPLDVSARVHLIDQLTAHGQLVDAAHQTLELADVYYRLAQLDKARDTYDQALRLVQGEDVDASWNVQILHQMADIDMQRLDWRKAVRVFEQLRTLAPNDELARLNLVQLNLRLGQTNKANLELDNYLSSLNNRGQERDAANFLRRIVDENPGYLLGRRRLAELFQQNGQREDAIREWNKVGELLVAAGDREGAKAAVRAILALDPPNAQRYQQFLNRLGS
jgi:tetratricopeptide (TPR) repeat protein